MAVIEGSGDRLLEAASAETFQDANRNTQIVVSMTDNCSGHKYDKKCYCCYCNLPHSKLVRHLKLKHGDEGEVKFKKMVQETDKMQQNMIILKLRNLGNHLHNCKVVASGKGDFLVVHRPHKESDYREYVHCKYCYGYFSKRSIRKHACFLMPKSDVGKKAAHVRKGNAEFFSDKLDRNTSDSSSALMSGLRQDAIGTVASN